MYCRMAVRAAFEMPHLYETCSPLQARKLCALGTSVPTPCHSKGPRLAEVEWKSERTEGKVSGYRATLAAATRTILKLETSREGSFLEELPTMTVDPSHVPPQSHLLYLYLWPFWMFEDANYGSLLERAAAYRHNREKRIYLPGYMVKWCVMFLMFAAAVSILENMGNTDGAWKLFCAVLAGAAGVLATWAFVVTVLVAVAYLFLTRWEC